MYWLQHLKEFFVLETLKEKSTLEPTSIIEDYLSGYHRCCLEQPYHLDYASPGLCSILGYTSDEMHYLFHDKYSQMVYEKDRKRYLHFIERLALKEQTLSLQYRMVCKDGHMIYMNDTMTSRRLEDGRMYGFAVVADISDNRMNEGAHASMIPQQLIDSYGFLQCTCTKYPKIMQANAQMMHYLGQSEDNPDWQGFLKDNIFFLIPFEERDLFRRYLDAVNTSSDAITIEHHFLRSDGSSVPMTGWLSRIKNEYGEPVYSFVYMCAEHTHQKSQMFLENSYFHALKNAYNIIFELNLYKQTVECIHGNETSAIGSLYDVHMTIESARNFWLNHYIHEDDRAMMEDFLKRISSPPTGWHGSSVIQSEFRIHWVNNITYRFLGVALQLDASTVLLCCRDISNVKYSRMSTQEEIALNKLDPWVAYFASQNRQDTGILLLEEYENKFSLVYASESLRSYLNLNQTDYLHYITGDYPLESLLEHAYLPQERMEALMRDQMISFEVAEKGSEMTTVTVTCQSYDYSGKHLYNIAIHSSFDADEVLQTDTAARQPSAEVSYTDTLQTPSHPRKKVFARTFGHFDLFVDQIPVSFSSNKEKELMALLIDRNGGTLTTSEAIGYLWENEVASERVSSRYRKLAMSLKNTLTRYGIEYILINNHGTRSVNTSMLKCDYYELISGSEKYREAFHNAYMTDYSWAENTLATLWDYS
jgi:PAS domain S-box-containing protein